jgi:hypothetical protein
MKRPSKMTSRSLVLLFCSKKREIEALAARRLRTVNKDQYVHALLRLTLPENTIIAIAVANALRYAALAGDIVAK